MEGTDRIGKRDWRRSMVRRITVGIAAASLAVTAGTAGLLGATQHDNTASATSTSDTGSSGTPSTAGDGLHSPGSAPESSSGQSTVTSGGS